MPAASSLVRDRLAGKPVVAHNASFDFSVLRHSLDTAGVDYPELLSYYCTRVFALHTGRTCRATLSSSWPIAAASSSVTMTPVKMHEPQPRSPYA
jgi:DNA polymerase III epsilon subunit-like protein